MQLFANNAFTTLAAAITAAATSLSVQPGQGARFPTPAAGDYFLVTLFQLIGGVEANHEVVKVTARSVDTFTIVRGQEGTAARAWGVGDQVSHRASAGTLGGLAQLGAPANFTQPVYVPTPVPGTNTTQTATTAFVTAAINQLKSDLIANSPAALDTLNEIAAALGNDANFAATTTTALGNRLRVDVNTQGLTAQQKANAVTNLGLATVATSGAKADVGLGNVDNTSDVSKPVSTAQQAALDLKAPTANPTFTGTVAGVTKAHVGLGNADNTSDVNKPVSTAQQTALNLKADLASPTFTGAPKAPTPASSDSSTLLSTTAFVQTLLQNLGWNYTGAGPLMSNLDDATIVSGFYYTSGSTLGTFPGGGAALSGAVIHKAYGSAGLQIFNSYGADRLYWRRRSGNAWGNWNELANLVSPAFTGTPTAPTAASGTNTTQLATTAFVGTAISNLVASSPAALDTLNELANALGNDANFATTTATSLGNRLRVDVNNQGLTAQQKANAATNLGLDQVNNTSDVNKPVSTAQQAALNAKAPLASPNFTGTASVGSQGTSTGYLQTNSGTNDAYTLIYNDGTKAVLHSSYSATAGAQPIVFSIGGSVAEVARFDTLGNLLVGSSSLAYKVTAAGAIYSTLGSGGMAMCGDTGPDTGFLGYNYTNVSGTETAPAANRPSYRIGFSNGATDAITFGRRAANAAAGSWTELGRFDASGNLLVGTVTSGGGHAINKTTSEGSKVLDVVGYGAGGIHVYSAIAGGANAAAKALEVDRHSTTGRSINAGGTINASGADYAEYMTKADACGELAKGQIVGIDADGKLTDQWASAVSFLIKSTDPSYVGGDAWGNEEALGCARPVEPQLVLPEYSGAQYPGEAPVAPTAPQLDDSIEAADNAEVQAAYQQALTLYQQALDAHHEALQQYTAAMVVYEQDQTAHDEAVTAAKYEFKTVTFPAYEVELAAFEELLEQARQKVDRIAYCGQVPVNVLGAKPGDYVVPAPDQNGGIQGVLVPKAELNFGMYRDAVGIVQNILPDGRANVRVKPV